MSVIAPSGLGQSVAHPAASTPTSPCKIVLIGLAALSGLAALGMLGAGIALSLPVLAACAVIPALLIIPFAIGALASNAPSYSPNVNHGNYPPTGVVYHSTTPKVRFSSHGRDDRVAVGHDHRSTHSIGTSVKSMPVSVGRDRDAHVAVGDDHRSTHARGTSVRSTHVPVSKDNRAHTPVGGGHTRAGSSYARNNVVNSSAPRAPVGTRKDN